MNLRLVARYLGIVCLLIGGFMVFSMPWAHPDWGLRHADHIAAPEAIEWRGLQALFFSCLSSLVVGMGLYSYGRKSTGQMFRKEAMAVVGLSWALATVLGGLPFVFAACGRGPAVRLHEGNMATVYNGAHAGIHPWRAKQLTPRQYTTLQRMLAGRVPEAESDEAAVLETLMAGDRDWAGALDVPGERGLDGRSRGFRVVQCRMNWADALFESQSGFSTTGATVISDLEDPRLVPHCILFWRSSTHFLGGLGIIVLFVVLLGQGSAGKALMRAELPGPTQESSQARMQHAAWQFAGLYLVLNVILTVCLWLFGLSMFDAICHAFGTMATGGFSTYNSSLGHFQHAGIEFTVILFMIVAGTSFTLLWGLRTNPTALFRDVEWRTYITIILFVTLLVMLFGFLYGDFDPQDTVTPSPIERLYNGLRYGLFQVVSIITTTGYGTHDFDRWNHFARGMLFLLMFVGGCAGSTGGGMKVIRHILFVKILRLEVELSFHPSVVRPLRIGGEAVKTAGLRKNILVYFGLITAIFAGSWLCVLLFEADATWGVNASNKLVDSASAVAATLNNIGPGLGTVGSTQNYGHFGWPAKLLFTWLMMLGRVEVFVILCLFQRRFWRSA